MRTLGSDFLRMMEIWTLAAPPRFYLACTQQDSDHTFSWKCSLKEWMEAGKETQRTGHKATPSPLSVAQRNSHCLMSLHLHALMASWFLWMPHVGAWPDMAWFLVSLLFSHPVGSDSLQPHGLQHVRPPWPSPSPRVCPSSCPLHQWCHPAISSLSPTWHINKFPYLKGLNLLQIAWLSGLSPRKPLTHLCSCSVT